MREIRQYTPLILVILRPDRRIDNGRTGRQSRKFPLHSCLPVVLILLLSVDSRRERRGIR